ncbi:hypothetical protein ACU686_21510 [Yinghuangia aomiensis]
MPPRAGLPEERGQPVRGRLHVRAAALFAGLGLHVDPVAQPLRRPGGRRVLVVQHRGAVRQVAPVLVDFLRVYDADQVDVVPRRGEQPGDVVRPALQPAEFFDRCCRR